MTFKEIHLFTNQIRSEIIDNPENAYLMFKNTWPTLSLEDQGLLGPDISYYCKIKLQPQGYIPLPENLAEQKICCTGILNIIQHKLIGNPQRGALKMKKPFKPKHMATFYKMMYDIGMLNNTLPEIAQVATWDFGLKNANTVENYFSKPAELQQAAFMIKRAIDNSNLIKGTF